MGRALTHVVFPSFWPGKDFLFPKNATLMLLHLTKTCWLWDLFPSQNSEMTIPQKNAYTFIVILCYCQILDSIFLSTCFFQLLQPFVFLLVDLIYLSLCISFWVNIGKMIHKWFYFWLKTLHELRSIRPASSNLFQIEISSLCLLKENKWGKGGIQNVLILLSIFCFGPYYYHFCSVLNAFYWILTA